MMKLSCIDHNSLYSLLISHRITNQPPTFSLFLTLAWSKYGPWSICSASCDFGTKQRSRVCILPDGNHGDPSDCVNGSDEVTMACQIRPCKVRFYSHVTLYKLNVSISAIQINLLSSHL